MNHIKARCMSMVRKHEKAAWSRICSHEYIYDQEGARGVDLGYPQHRILGSDV